MVTFTLFCLVFCFTCGLWACFITELLEHHRMGVTHSYFLSLVLLSTYLVLTLFSLLFPSGCNYVTFSCCPWFSANLSSPLFICGQIKRLFLELIWWETRRSVPSLLNPCTGLHILCVLEIFRHPDVTQKSNFTKEKHQGFVISANALKLFATRQK